MAGNAPATSLTRRLVMAIPDWALIGTALAMTLLLCTFARFLVGRSSRAAAAVCVVAGLAVTPVVVFGGFRIAGSIVGTHNSKIWFLLAWLLCLSVSLAFARAYWKR